MKYLENYLNGQEEETWQQLVDLGGAVRDAENIGEARAVAREAMKRARRNIERLIPRWENAGHVFGYEWARKRSADDVKSAPPLLGSPDENTIAALDQFEKEKGPLPIVLRAFYDIIGAVNFVGTPVGGWPDRETLDPLQIASFPPQLPALLEGHTEEVLICPDHLHKYFISGVGGITVEVPAPCFDSALVFEGVEMEWRDKPLTMGLYLRWIILRRGGIGLVAGWNDDAPDRALIESLTSGLEPF